MKENHNDILDLLEERIDRAVAKIAELKRKVALLTEEKKDLEAILAEREIRIEGLQKQVEELKEKSNLNQVEKYKQNEKLLRERIVAMLSKLDELKSLD